MRDPERRLTPEEYLELEKDGPVRHEYAGGKLFAMAGASDEHNRITRNITGLLWQATRRGPCQTYASDMKVRVGPVFYYPDVLVSCDPTDIERYFKTRPCLIVEVLSESTARVDWGEKLYNYRTGLESLETYVLVHQDRRRLEVFRRLEGDRWLLETLEGTAALELPCPPVTLALDEVYEGVEPVRESDGVFPPV